jgi:hypothetical protein
MENAVVPGKKQKQKLLNMFKAFFKNCLLSVQSFPIIYNAYSKDD